MLHEGILTYDLHISQELKYVGYALSFTAYLWYFRQELFKSEYKILLTAIFLLALSIVDDIILLQEAYPMSFHRRCS